MDGGLAVVGHEADERRVPLVDDLGEGGGARGHEHHADAVLEAAERLLVDAQEGLRRALLGVLVLEVPHAVLLGELLVERAALGQDADFEAAHGEQQVGVVLAVDREERVVPLDRGERPQEPVLDVPEDGAAEVDVVLHEAHAGVAGPALLVVVADDVLVVGVRVLGEVALDELLGLVVREAEAHVDPVDVARVEADRVAGLLLDGAEGEEVVGHLRRAGDLRRAGEAEHEEVEHEAVVLEDERRELEAADEAVRVGVIHVLVVHDHVVLGRHVVGDVVVEDEAQEPVEQREIDLLVDLLELGLHQHDALALARVPHVGEVVDALAPLVGEERRRLGVGGLDPVGEEVTLVGLIPHVLVEVGVGDLLERLDVVDRDQVAVEVHELDAQLLEGPLREEVALDPRQGLVRVVVGLLDKAELLALRLVEPALDAVGLLEVLERQDEQLRVVLVVERRERDRRELAALEPVHRRGVDRDGLLGGDVRPVLEVVVLPLLLGLEPQPREPTEVLLAHGLVDGGAPADALAVVVRDVGPPVGLGLDVAQDHVLDRRRQAGHLPRDVGLPAAPRLAEVLEDGARLVGPDALGHHVEDVVHDRGPELEIEVALHALLGDGLGDALGVAALELPGEQVAQPPLEQRHDAAEEEEPHAPGRRPDAAAGTLADGTSVEAVVDEVLEVLAHADLAHEAVLVSVHAGELADVREDVLEAVGELEGVDVAEAEVDVGVDDELREPEDLATQMEGVTETRLLALLGGERLDGLEVEVVVEVEVVEVLAVDEEVEHVVALPTHLQTGLHPIELRRLEELGRRQRAEEVALVERLRRPVLELVEHVALEQLLVAHADLDRVVLRAVLHVPRLDERHVLRAPRAARAEVERARRPVERDAAGRVVGEEVGVLEQRLDALRQRERGLLVVVELVVVAVAAAALLASPRRDGVDERVEVERRQIGVVGLDVDGERVVVGGDVHAPRAVVVEVGERDLVLRAQLVADDEFVDVVELVPVLVGLVDVAVHGLEFGAAGDGHVERLGREEGLGVEEVEVVLVVEVAEQLAGETVEIGHDGERQTPALVARPVDVLGVGERPVIVQPIFDGGVLDLLEFHLDRVERLDVHDVVAVVERRLLVVERRESHALEMPTISLLAPHHDPHRTPLRDVDGLDDQRDLVDERDGARDVVEHRHVAHLLPRHRHVLEQLEDRMRHVLERSQVHALVVPELLARHVAVILDDLADVLGGHVLLLRLDVPEFPLLSISL